MMLTLSHLLAAIHGRLLSCLSLVMLVLAIGTGSALAAADGQGEFEQALKENFPGSYMLYTSLSGEARSRVFKEYKRNATDPGLGRFAKVIAKILELTIEEDKASRSKPPQKKHS